MEVVAGSVVRQRRGEGERHEYGDRWGVGALCDFVVALKRVYCISYKAHDCIGRLKFD